MNEAALLADGIAVSVREIGPDDVPRRGTWCGEATVLRREDATCMPVGLR